MVKSRETVGNGINAVTVTKLTSFTILLFKDVIKKYGSNVG